MLNLLLLLLLLCFLVLEKCAYHEKSLRIDSWGVGMAK